MQCSGGEMVEALEVIEVIEVGQVVRLYLTLPGVNTRCNIMLTSVIPKMQVFALCLI